MAFYAHIDDTVFDQDLVVRISRFFMKKNIAYGNRYFGILFLQGICVKNVFCYEKAALSLKLHLTQYYMY